MKLKEFVDVLFAEDVGLEAEGAGQASPHMFVSLHLEDKSEVGAPGYERQPVELVGRVVASGSISFENLEPIAFDRAGEDWGVIVYFALNKGKDSYVNPHKLFRLGSSKLVNEGNYVVFSKGDLAIVTHFGDRHD